MTVLELETVLAWHEALNTGEAERVASLSHPDVEVGGPRGSARGRQVLKDWLGRANVRLEPLRLFQGGGTVVAEEAATWRDAGTGETTGAATVATVFKPPRRPAAAAGVPPQKRLPVPSRLPSPRRVPDVPSRTI